MPGGSAVRAGCWAANAFHVVALAAAADAAWQADARICSRSALEFGEADAWDDLCTWTEDTCGLPTLGRFFEAEFDKGGVRVTGIGSAQAFHAGEDMGCLRSDCFLATGDATYPKLLRDLEEEDYAPGNDCEDYYELMAIYLAEEELKGNASRIWPYFGALPSESKLRLYHPAYLQDVLPAELRRADYRKPRMRWPHWRRSFLKCVALYGAESGRLLSRREAFRNYVHVVARHFEYKGLIVLLPFIDKMNAGLDDDLNVELVYHPDENGMLSKVCMVAGRDIAPGDELMLDYEFKGLSVTEYFETFGFILRSDHHPKITQTECRVLSAHAAPGVANPTPALQALRRLSRDFCT